MFFIDIHTHPTLKPFKRKEPKNLFNFENYENFFKASNFFSRLLSKILKLITADIPKYSQSNINSLYAGNFRVAIISLFSLEEEFKKSNILNEKLSLDMFSLTVGIQQKNLSEYNNKKENYFKQLECEYLFLLNNQNSNNINNYKLVRNFKEIQKSIKLNKNEVCLINSIEGIQCLSGYDEINNFNSEELLTTTKENINIIKNWEFPPFFITMNHHFWNGFSSHAPSVTRIFGKPIFNQKNKFKGINEQGEEIIKYLMSQENGKRILIDIKHFDAQSRKDFYKIVKKNKINAPIICSHTGVNTYDSLDDIIKGYPFEKNKKSYFHEWEINICKEDVVEIVDSGGLIGIQFDFKRLCGKGVKNKIKNDKKKILDLIFANIFKIVEFGGEKAWNHICIGTDFDGMISKIPFYNKNSDFNDLYNDMLEHLLEIKEIKNPKNNEVVFSESSIVEILKNKEKKDIINRFFGDNAKEFLKRNF
jgi:hypothetical protein